MVRTSQRTRLQKSRHNAIRVNVDGTNNVKSFGAVLDGVTDDYSAIQNAVSQGGKIVFPPNSTAYVSQPISVFSNTVIDCQNSTIRTVPGGSIFRAVGTQSDMLTNVEIENCNLDGQASQLGAGDSSSVIYLDHTNHFLIHHNTVKNCGWWCVQADFSNDGAISGNYLSNALGDCAGWEQGDGVKIVGNTCDGFRDGGFSANVNASDGLIADNIVKNGTGNSFGIEVAGAHDVTVSSNVVKNGYGQNGIRLLANDGFDTYNVVITNNLVGNARSGEFCINATAPNQASHPNQPIVIANNLLHCGDGGGIYVWADDAVVGGNSISSRAVGIDLDGNGSTTSNNLYVKDNVIVGTTTGVQKASSVFNSVTLDNPVFPVLP